MTVGITELNVRCINAEVIHNSSLWSTSQRLSFRDVSTRNLYVFRDFPLKYAKVEII